MSVLVYVKDGQVLKSQNLRKSLKSEIFVLFSDKSLGNNALATKAITKSKCSGSQRKGSFFSDAPFCLCGFVSVRLSLIVPCFDVCEGRR